MTTATGITPVILCGGSGTRLWPLSRKSFPKQFVPLIDGQSLLELTLQRVQGLGEKTLCVTNNQHRFLVAEAMNASGTAGDVLLEPEGRNTAPAMVLAALHAQARSAADQLLLFCPADHFIPDVAAFTQAVQAGVEMAQQGQIVTFGVNPTAPSTAYGYIQQGESNSDSSNKVARFIEKPTLDKAQQLLLQGDVLWNAGIFLARADSLLAAVGEHAKDILTAVTAAMEQVVEDSALSGVGFFRPDSTAFSQSRSESIDYAVLEHHAAVSVVPFSGQWSDVGSWNAVADLNQPDERGNRLDGEAVAHECDDTYIHAPHRPVVALGTRNLLVVDTPDAVLVADSSRAEQVKDVVGILMDKGIEEALSHRRVARPWGWYDSVDAGPRFQVKRIGVKPGASLSLQKHHHRAEHWIVVRGTAQVSIDDETRLVTENQSAYIPVGAVHRLHNPGQLELEMIEVQSGSYLGEDDIVRLEDNYGRSK